MTDLASRPFRSVLYIPADKPRALEKARGLACDSIIFDLEDAVAPEAKAPARQTLAQALEAGYGGRFRLVRINALDTDWGPADLRAVAEMDLDAVLVPKVSRPDQLDAVAARLDELRPGLPLWAMMETAEGTLNAAAIAAHPRLQGMVMGTNDLAKEMMATIGPDRAELQMALQHALLAARAAGVIIVDGVYNKFKDEEGLDRECAQGRAMGFDGKSLIHPAQIAIANTAFAPSEAALDLARRRIKAYKEARSQGEGVAVVDGQIVENLHIATDIALLDRAAAIAALQEESAE